MSKKIKILKAIANEKRLKILNLLQTNRDLSVSEIAQEINLHFKSTSKHLQILENADLIERTRQGFRVKYNLKPKINNLLKIIKKI